MEPTGRIPPQNTDAEASLLGSILIDADALGRIADKIHGDDFYDSRHQIIYEAMISLYNAHKPVDLLTLSNQLEEKKQLTEAGGSSYLTELTNTVPTSAHIEQYAEIVSQKATRRKIIAAATDITTLGFNEDGDSAELLSKAEAAIFNVSQGNMKQEFFPKALTVLMNSIKVSPRCEEYRLAIEIWIIFWPVYNHPIW